jgi:polyphenol oxidase
VIALDALKTPGVAHGFFTRDGGVSGGIYASLNCGNGSGDDPAAVAENRARAAAALGVTRDALATNHQVHGSDIVTVTDGWRARPRAHADGLVTMERGVALGILTADCVPVLFADAEAGVIGAAHAGWRGAVCGVLEATIQAMAALGAERSRIHAGFGPAIAQASYEVGPEFPAPFLAQDPGNERFFVGSPNGKSRFDLPGYVRARLERLGLAAVAATGGDTAAEPERFFSYRRSRLVGEQDYGRLLSAIALL